MIEQVDSNVILLASTAVIRDRKVLLIREREEPYHGLWVLPQGYVKRYERVIDAAKREVSEELNIDVKMERLLGVYDDLYYEKDMHYVIVCYIARLNGSDQPKASAEAIDFAWVDPDQDLKNTPEVIHRILMDIASLR